MFNLGFFSQQEEVNIPPLSPYSTHFLMNYENGDGTTPVTDDTGSRTITYNNSSVTNSEAKFGNGGLGFSSTSGYLVTDNSQDFNLSNGEDFTFETFIHASNNADYTNIFGIYENNSATGDFLSVAMQNIGGNDFRYYLQAKSPGIKSAPGTVTSSTGGWIHVAMVGGGGSYDLYVGGNKSSHLVVGTFLYDDAYRIFLNNKNNVYYDSTRFVKGIQLYTENFIPPTAPLEEINVANPIVVNAFETSDVSSIDMEEVLPFITQWKTDNSGVSNNDQVRITTNSGTYAYNYDVDWGDGNTSTGLTGDHTHTYAASGTYTVSITGLFPQLYFVNSSQDNDKLISVDQWGNNKWSSMERFFYDCSNLYGNAVDIPDLSNVTDMNNMFVLATSFNQDISSWDVSNVIDMNNMFRAASAFNQPLNSWNVSNVTDMSFMLAGVDSFNQPLNSWDVSNVTDMSFMFNGATLFNSDISSWNVSSVTDMSTMFNNATSFNSDISSWNVSSVTNMSTMFRNAPFNQDISSWIVSSVTDMSYMFNLATNFNSDISSWNVSNVTDMNNMFRSSNSFDQPLNSWNVSNVTDMNNMFRNTNTFNQDISSWNVSSVTNIGEMFRSAAQFNQDISSWNVSSVTNMSGVFREAFNFNQDISSWNVSNVTNMNTMFYNANFDQDIGSWDVSSVTDMVGLFGLTSISTSNYDSLLIGWSALMLQNNVTLDAGSSIYSASSQDERDILTGTYNWTITDGGYVPLLRTVYLWDMEGTNGTSPIGDTDLTGNVAIALSDDTEYSNVNPIYGNTSITTTAPLGETSRIETETSEILNLYGKDFTIECSSELTRVSNFALQESTIFSILISGGNGFVDVRATKSQLVLYVNNEFFSTYNYTDGVKVDWAVTREDDTFYFFVDGVLQSSKLVVTTPLTVTQPKITLYTQLYVDPQSDVLVKNDSLRVISGEALYTSNYTPTNAQLGFYGTVFRHDFEGIAGAAPTLQDDTGKVLTPTGSPILLKGSNPAPIVGNTYAESSTGATGVLTTNLYNDLNLSLEPFTISMYLYVDADAVHSAVQTSFFSINDGTPNNSGPNLYISGNDSSTFEIDFWWTNTGGTPSAVTLTSSTLNVGQWYKITAGHDGSNLRLFIDLVDQGVNPGSRLSPVGQQELRLSTLNSTFHTYLDSVEVFSGKFTPPS